jgi:hypothetical protein
MTSAQDDLQAIDSDLRSIHLHEAPRFKPLDLDKMFRRAQEWGEAHPIAKSPPRPPSPTRKAQANFPLPQPLAHGLDISPLEGLFAHAELVPLVLQWFERPKELAVLARVNKEFLGIARKKLYQNIWIRPCLSFHRSHTPH